MGRKKLAIFTAICFAVILNSANAGDCEDEVICEKVVPQLESISAQVNQFPRQVEEAFTKLSGSLENVINGRTVRLEKILDTLANQMNGFAKTLQQLTEKLGSQNIPEATPKDTQSANPELENTEQPPKASLEIKAISDDYEIIPEATIDAAALFVTSKHYSNARMATNLTNAFQSLEFPKHVDKNDAHAQCSHYCWQHDNCQAFNLIAKDDNTHECEFLADNFCLNTTSNALLNWPGSTLWEKISTHTEEACLDAKFPSGQEIPCETVRPGCLGNWPQCTNCSQTCKDVFLQKRRVLGHQTLWPEGDGPYTTPVFAFCSGYKTALAAREIDMQTGEFISDYKLSPYDMHRISRLNAYPTIRFEFAHTKVLLCSLQYDNWFIDANGTLMNMTYNRFFSRAVDIFNLKNQPMKPTPFVTVTDDRYGCGSFWLIDANNATYCPGGKVSMFGKVQIENGKVVNTGMSLPVKMRKNEKINYVGIFLN